MNDRARSLRRVALPALVAALAMVVPATAGAHRAIYHHHHHYVAPPPPPPPVYYEPPAPAQPLTPSEADQLLLGIGIRVSGIAFEGYKLHISDLENPVMGGVGLQFRSKFSRHWGLELAADYLRGADDNFVQWTIPVTLSAMFFLFPDSRINPYGLFGGGVFFTRMEYQDGLFEHDIIEAAGLLGAGVQVRLGDSFAIHADLRFMGVWKNLDDEVTIRSECLSAVGSQRGFCNNLSSLDTDDKFNAGLQFQAGATYFF